MSTRSRLWNQLADLATRATAAQADASADAGADAGANAGANAPKYSAQNHVLEAAGLVVDFSRQMADAATRTLLTDLARAAELPAAIEAMFSGEVINNTEGRAVLHTALRAPATLRPAAAAEVEDEQQRFTAFVDAIRNGEWRGCTNRSITDVVHIGIGGSHLGPELVTSALRHLHTGPRVHFVANIDPQTIRNTLSALNPDRTLFVIASKTFTTLETQQNANAARSWFLERVGEIDAIARHFVAVTNNTQAASEFGIPGSNAFKVWDWVGGRYSLWSAVGLPIALAVGNTAFNALLSGAHTMDTHFRQASLPDNIPVQAALYGIWNSNFLGRNNLAILPYDDQLHLLPLFLQQLDMESNGKRVQRDGSAVGVHTGPIVWGSAGTNGQHAFHQLLHQGTRGFAADFVIIAGNQDDDAQRWLVANALAQGQAFQQGQNHDDPHRVVPGAHPSTTIILTERSPAQIGALLAMYEHKVFCQGVIWQINSFDQWGVELGKALARPIFEQLGGSDASTQDPATRELIQRIRRDHGR